MIQKYYNVFSSNDLDLIWKYLVENKWQFGHVSLPSSNKKFWSMNFDEEIFFYEHLFNKIKNIIGQNYTLQTVYANGHTYGMEGEFHLDSPDINGFTFLYYPHYKWKKSWNGCTTILIDEENFEMVYPTPNSAIMFPSLLWHRSEPVSREFYDLRVTIAFKIIKNDNN